MPQLLGAKLRHIRRAHGMTQGELARHLSLASYTHISRLEVDQRTPSLDLVVRIATLFNQSTDYLLRDTIAVEVAAPSTINTLADGKALPQLFGAKLRALRLRHGWGQTDLARKLGLARRGYISNLETGRKAPSLDLVVQIADLFGVTTDYLLRDTIPVEEEGPRTED
jgi:transcriptional regulator with XRE-family HTH domain